MKSMCQDVRRNSPSVADCKPDVALQLHRGANGLVLDRPQAGVVELAGGMTGARREQLGRPEQAPDVVGPEGRREAGPRRAHAVPGVGRACFITALLPAATRPRSTL